MVRAWTQFPLGWQQTTLELSLVTFFSQLIPAGVVLAIVFLDRCLGSLQRGGAEAATGQERRLAKLYAIKLIAFARLIK